MFDPTIFDNLKVVLEGSLYDWDAEGQIAVTRREDLLDLAGMGRSFRMELRIPGSAVYAAVRLSAALPDFAAELRGMRLAGERPGAELELVYHIPGKAAADRFEAVHELLDKQWDGDTADLSHEEIVRRSPGADPVRSFQTVIRFRQKMDESRMEELQSFVAHLIESLQLLDELLGG